MVIFIENKITLCAVQTPIKNWRRCIALMNDSFPILDCYKSTNLFLKALEKNHYEDENIKLIISHKPIL